MSKENIDLIKQIYRHFNAREYDRVVENFADDFDWFAADNSPLADRSPYRGVKEIRDGVFGRIENAFSRLNFQIAEIIDADDRIVLLGHYEGEYASGSPAPRAQAAHVWTIRNGKGIKFQQYLDTLAVARGPSAVEAD